MGGFGDDSPDEDRIHTRKREVEMIKIQERLNQYPMSFFSRGDIRFLDTQLRRIRMSCSISEESLARARAIELSCIDKAEELAATSRDLEALRIRRKSQRRKV